jgi:glycosyltransferase involved in cell wall biosynthesis
MLKYVTAFPGRRDSYQIPLSLFENGRLLKFLTDGYDSGLVAGALKIIGARATARRRCQGLPDAVVETNFRFELWGGVLRRTYGPSRAAVLSDAWLARRAAAAANSTGASVFLYEFQAELCFRLLRSSRQRKILFHFHPHPGWEHRLFASDVRGYPQFARLVDSITRSNMPTRFSEHTREAWRGADHILVASSCTRESLVQVGCPVERISVVPYGREAVEGASMLASEPKLDRPFFLWVGAGSYRKGLHHLCRAWKAAGCGKEADLVIVARVLDPGMETLVHAEGIRWLKGVSRAELNWYYGHACCFVMPSLSEGFGQVYLEALANGCPVIGTRNSVLPDLEGSQQWIHYVEPGDFEALAEKMRELLRNRSGERSREKNEIMASVQGYSWERFRRELEMVLRRFD